METVPILLIILSATSLASAENLILRNVRQAECELIQPVSLIIKDFYKAEGTFVHLVNVAETSNNHACKEIVTEVLHNISGYISVGTGDFQGMKKAKGRRKISVITFIDSLESFNKLRSEFSTENVKFRRFYTVVFTYKVTEANMKPIFDKFWEVLITKVNIIAMNENGFVNLFTFLPFDGKKCGDTSPIIINTFDKDLMKWKLDVFHPLKTRNLHKCPIFFTGGVSEAEPFLMARNNSRGVTEVYGCEKEILEEISKRVNFTPVFEIHGNFPGNLFENGTASGNLEKVIRGENDAAIGFISLQYTRTLFLSESKAFAVEPLSIVIPPGEVYGDIEKFARPFSLPVWIAIYLTTAFSIFMIIFLSHLSTSSYKFLVGRNVNTPICNVFSIALGVSQAHLPKRNFARFILINLILCLLVIRSAYQGGVYKILKSGDCKPEVSSINEIIERNYVLYIYETLASRMETFELYNRRKVFPNNEIQNFRLKTLNSSFEGVVFTYLDQVLYQNAINYKNFTLKVCKEQFLTNPIVFYFRKNHYLVEEVNNQIELMLTNGMIQKIIAGYADKRFLKTNEEYSEQKTLTIEHFTGAFRIFGILCTIATTIFAFEMMTNITKLRFMKKAMDYIEYRLTK